MSRISDSDDRFGYQGCEFAYTVAGSGEPVLWIQGTAVHGDGWMPQTEELSDQFECIWFDNRGMFDSQPAGDAPITIEQMADDCRALLDHLGHDAAHIVGHSLGGCIALQFALEWPDRVKTLSLLCAAASGPGLVKMDGAGLWRGIRTQLGTKRSRRRAFLEIVLSPDERAAADSDQIAAELKPVFGHDLAVSPPGTMKQVAAMRHWDVRARLDELADIPTLVCGGRHDPIATPPLVEALAAGIPGAVLEMFEQSAHGLTVTESDRTNQALRYHFGSEDDLDELVISFANRPAGWVANRQITTTEVSGRTVTAFGQPGVLLRYPMTWAKTYSAETFNRLHLAYGGTLYVNAEHVSDMDAVEPTKLNFEQLFAEVVLALHDEVVERRTRHESRVQGVQKARDALAAGADPKEIEGTDWSDVMDD